MSLWWLGPLIVGAAAAGILAVAARRLEVATARLRPLTRDLMASTAALRRARRPLGVDTDRYRDSRGGGRRPVE